MLTEICQRALLSQKIKKPSTYAKPMPTENSAIKQADIAPSTRLLLFSFHDQREEDLTYFPPTALYPWLQDPALIWSQGILQRTS